MQQVELYTSTGGYVTTVSCPPMNPMPEVIQWGSRYFIRKDVVKQQQDGGTFLTIGYFEGLLWYSPESFPVEQKES